MVHARLRNCRLSAAKELQFAALLLGALVAVYVSMKEDSTEHYNNSAMFEKAMMPIIALVYLFAYLRSDKELFSFCNTLLGYHVGFGLPTAIFTLHILFVRPDEMLASCINGSSVDAVMDVCQKMIKDLKPHAVIGLCCVLIEICGFVYLISDSWFPWKSGGESTKRVD
ncbi:hypothetical protein C8J57DRAFT_1352244 [Mycena rebaudengoi]|nr:hypothetical protein C8J57DRAFT_1352244 [Mycena rebaudengoi]